MQESQSAEPVKPVAAEPDRFSWTASQRRVIAGLLIFMCCLLTIRYACNSRYVPDPQPQFPTQGGELADRIDPNTADWEMIAVIPGLGDKRAKEIVAYRDEFIVDHPGKRAFNQSQDLLRVRGIGAAMVESMEPYLIFPPAGSATKP